MDVTQYLLLGNALLLGFRHGIDWDHIAAITDIVGTTTTNDADRQIKMSQLQSHAIGLSSVYALGHAFIVVLLGIAAICFSKILPNWVDPIMERVVGFTLLFLSGYILFSLAMFVRGKGQIKLQSRWMLLISLVRKVNAKLRNNSSRKNELEDNEQAMAYGWRTAFGIGMIHGIGAETGTQVLLIAALGGAATHGLGLAMLATFVVGLTHFQCTDSGIKLIRFCKVDWYQTSLFRRGYAHSSLQPDRGHLLCSRAGRQATQSRKDICVPCTSNLEARTLN